jgi:hypothetical protein
MSLGGGGTVHGVLGGTVHDVLVGCQPRGLSLRGLAIGGPGVLWPDVIPEAGDWNIGAPNHGPAGGVAQEAARGDGPVHGTIPGDWNTGPSNHGLAGGVAQEAARGDGPVHGTIPGGV